jgi:two-component sensor histidine kinase
LRRESGSDQLHLNVVDNGIGVSVDLLSQNRPSLGMQLV